MTARQTAPASYETFEHTADLGLRVQAADLNTLFATAAAGLCSMLVEHPECVEQRESRRFEIASDDPTYLYFDWLNELLYVFESEGLLLPAAQVQVEGNRLTAEASGEKLDPDRHGLGHEVKAVTYHALKLEQLKTNWQAEVIVDI